MNELTQPGSGNSEPLAKACWADPSYIARRYRYQEGAVWLGRSPHDFGSAIGYRDDRHVFVCAETGGGKGRAFMVNNQVLWPGSLISVGPKGDEATMAAPRRGPGNAHCDGLGQEVYVLDPMGACEVPDSLRAHFNPLSALNPEDGELVAKVDRVANAICRIAEGGDIEWWAREGKAYVANVMLHVVTSPFFKDEERNLLTVRNLVLEGNVAGARAVLAMKQKFASEEGSPANGLHVDPHEQLLDDMIANQRCDGAVSRGARNLRSSFAQHVEGFESARKLAASHVRFLEGRGISRTVAGPGAYVGAHPRTFKVDDLRGERPVSVFITLPEQNYDPLDRWLRAMIQILIEGLQERQGLPASGERVLFCIDEFANLGKMEVLDKAANSLRSAGVKLMLATQRLGDLTRLYGKSWEKFVSSAGAQIWFNTEELETREYLEKKLGLTEVAKLVRSRGVNSSQAQGTTITESDTYGRSTSQTSTQGESSGQTRGHSGATSRSESSSRGQHWQSGDSTGRTASRSYGLHVMFEPWKHGSQRGRNWSTSSSRGGSTQETAGSSVTEGWNASETTGHQRSESTQQGESHSRQEGRSSTDTSTRGDSSGISEQFHLRPLLSAQDARRYLLSPREADHPAYPGMALIIVADEENPFFLRKANHDEDPFFVRKFHPNPAFPFVPLNRQPLFGWQITQDHFYDVVIPDALQEEGLSFSAAVEEGDRVRAGATLFESMPDDPLGLALLPDREPHAIKFPVKVMRIHGGRDSGHLFELRFDEPVQRNSKALQAIEEQLWGASIRRAEERKLEERLAREREQAARDAADVDGLIAGEREALSREELALVQMNFQLNAEEMKSKPISAAYHALGERLSAAESLGMKVGLGLWLAVFLSVLVAMMLSDFGGPIKGDMGKLFGKLIGSGFGAFMVAGLTLVAASALWEKVNWLGRRRGQESQALRKQLDHLSTKKSELRESIARTHELIAARKARLIELQTRLAELKA